MTKISYAIKYKLKTNTQFLYTLETDFSAKRTWPCCPTMAKFTSFQTEYAIGLGYAMIPCQSFKQRSRNAPINLGEDSSSQD